MLKSDLHTHAKEDTQDHIPYTAKEFIDEAARKDFDVLSLTFHRKVFWKADIVRYAQKKGILLIPGCEMCVENRHVLIYNKSAAKLKRIVERIQEENRIDRINQLKQDCLVIAPHPYYCNPLLFF
ncbi:MAG: PHP domain-containing protein, partial [Nanoarchaeota archaeon]